MTDSKQRYGLSNDDLEELRTLTVAVNSGETRLYVTTQVVDDFNPTGNR
jgi:hypothetical protein